MTDDLVDSAFQLMNARRFGEALRLLRRVIDQNPSQWNAWELAGQCCRFLNDIEGAIGYLSHAAKLKSDEPSIFLALGIALQLGERWDDAIHALCRAIELDPDYDLAYNSLAFTQQKRGDLNKALDNYDAGAKALARRIVKGMQNSGTSRIFKTLDRAEMLWLKYALHAAMYLSSTVEGISGIAWPTGDQAQEEERTEKHGGLFWEDILDEKNEKVRFFLPNYFNTFRKQLKSDATYANLIGNRGTVLELLGRNDEARQHFDEANEFLPSVLKKVIRSG